MAEPIQRMPSRTGAAALLQAASPPVSDLTDAHMAHFFFCGPAAAPVGLVGVELFDDCALLRSLVVAESHRSKGLGRTLLSQAESYAHASGARVLYLLTTTAESFCARNGYSHAERARAPSSICESREFADLCPASSAFMVKHI